MPATGNVLLDTSVVVAVLRRVPGVKERPRNAQELLVPLVALGELEYGVNLATPRERQREAVRTFMEGCPCFCRQPAPPRNTDELRPR